MDRKLAGWSVERHVVDPRLDALDPPQTRAEGHDVTLQAETQDAQGDADRTRQLTGSGPSPAP